MLLTSLSFAGFFLCVFVIYLMLERRNQNTLLLVASWYFYACWDWRFLTLLWLSTGVAYFCAARIAKTRAAVIRRRWLALSIGTDLSFLGFFKYYDFFSTSLAALGARLGWSFDPVLLHVILPVGISFYTFHTISYIVDVYRGEVAAAEDFTEFALFVSFFPQLVAGPIARAAHLLPQMARSRKVTWPGIEGGAFLICWGLFQKTFVADNLATFVDRFFGGPGPYEGFETLLAAYAFSFQIYCDFAGYTNMARGLARILGFELAENFNRPYFARDPREFWRRWHISLSTWLRDYLYKPLGGNRKGSARTYINLAVTMLLGGLWHGANWTFVAWGGFHGLLLAGHRFFSDGARPRQRRPDSRLVSLGKTLLLFHAVALGWLVFRSRTLGQAGEVLASLVINFHPSLSPNVVLGLKGLALFVPVLFAVELVQELREEAAEILRWPMVARTALYVTIFYSLVFFGSMSAQSFIYFQF